jgi:hypothetical protein|nr:MAG TPA: hypothetical protein [Caudoviricetes sp.]
MHIFSGLIALLALGLLIFGFIKKDTLRLHQDESQVTFKQYVLSCLFFLVLGGICFIITDSPSESNNAPATQPTKQEQQNTGSAKDSASTPAEQIEQICRQKAGDKHFTKVEVNEDMSKENFGKGKLIVLPYVKDEAGFRQTGFALSGEIIRALYESGLPISEVTVFIQDMSEHTTMKCTMNEKTAKNINWDTVSYKHFDKYLDDVWMIPQLRK